MSMTSSLIDPLLYKSSFINTTKIPKINFWKKFHPYNFICNIILPIMLILIVSFILKDKYNSKLKKLNNILHTYTNTQYSNVPHTR